MVEKHSGPRVLILACCSSLFGSCFVVCIVTCSFMHAPPPPIKLQVSLNNEVMPRNRLLHHVPELCPLFSLKCSTSTTFCGKFSLRLTWVVKFIKRTYCTYCMFLHLYVGLYCSFKHAWINSIHTFSVNYLPLFDIRKNELFSLLWYCDIITTWYALKPPRYHPSPCKIFKAGTLTR